jgi:hypothetical protein
MMRFTRRPRIKWGLLPSPRSRSRHNRCGLCRRQVNRLFDVPDDVWLFYVGEEQRHQIVCIACWHWLTDAIDASAYEREHGGPVPLWSAEFRRRYGIAADAPDSPMPPWMTIASEQAKPTRRYR